MAISAYHNWEVASVLVSCGLHPCHLACVQRRRLSVLRPDAREDRRLTLDRDTSTAPRKPLSESVRRPIKEAHAYANGGAVIQDLGCYPFSAVEFSHLVHYVRSGDFGRQLILESQNADEFAFALCALAHYTSDITGHPAVNQAVTIQYPEVRAKFGNSVTFADDRAAHFGSIWCRSRRVVTRRSSFTIFIGFQVSNLLLERVFPVVHGVELKDVLTHEDLAVGSYRFAVSRMIPDNDQVGAPNAQERPDA
jgi:Zinc dependent phospholipase C